MAKFLGGTVDDHFAKLKAQAEQKAQEDSDAAAGQAAQNEGREGQENSGLPTA